MARTRIASSVLVILALVMALVPATAQANPVNITAYSAGTKPVGAPTATWGTASGAPNATVWTEVYAGGKWSRSQSRTTTSSGYFSIPLSYATNSHGTFTWRVGVSVNGKTHYSNSFRLTRFSISAKSAGSKTVGTPTSAWGTVAGAPHAAVWTEVYAGGKWSRSQSKSTSSTGYYSIPLTYGASTPGTRTWRVGVSINGKTHYSRTFKLTRLSISAKSAGSKTVGAATAAWGTAAGAPNSAVWTEVYVGGKWARSQTRTTTSSGYYSIPLTYGASTPGTRTWRVGVSVRGKTHYSTSFTLTRTAANPLNLAREAMWTRIAQCESNNNWSINTGNGYYGGLQFNLRTWLSVDGDDFAYYPHHATRAEQITVANRLYALRGTQPWGCA
ncbi:MAG: transglycosylase family protein [Arachnia sp.]